MFKASQDAAEGTGLSFLDIPYLGACNLVDVEITEINDTPNCFNATFGNLTDEAWDGDIPSQGTTHQHTEWAPSGQDDDKKVQNKVDRITYIASRVVPKEQALAVEGTDWASWLQAIVNLIKQSNHSDKQLYMKAPGNVYNGKTRVKFPGYRDFLSTQEGELSWSANEKAANEEYMQALRAPSSTVEDDMVADPDVEEAGF